ncbi:MAG: hypothetical protein QX197_04550 [Methylococcaceae bacterium]
MKITRVFLFAATILFHAGSATADIKADADRILDWGEATLPTLMSPHQPTNQFDKYWYRAYGNNDFYTAVNSQDNGVYYGSIAAFLNGVKPTFYKSVADALKDVAISGSTGSTSPSTLAPDFPSLAACVTNKWIMGAEQAVKLFDAAGMRSLPGFSVSSTGQNIITFSTDGSFQSSTNLSHVFTFSGGGGTAQSTGTRSGTWAVSDNTLTQSTTSTSESTTMTVSGNTTVFAESSVSAGPVKVVSCTPATLTFDTLPARGVSVRIVLVSG